MGCSLEKKKRVNRMGLYTISDRRSIKKQRLTLFGLASFFRICITTGVLLYPK